MIKLGAGAVAGLVGFGVIGAVTANWGMGFIVNVAAGSLSGAFAGQYGRLTSLVLSGQESQTQSSLLRWQNIVADGVLGGISGAIGYSIQRGVTGIGQDILEDLTNRANNQLVENSGLAQQVLSKNEYSAGQNTPGIAQMEYGNAVERMVAEQVKNSPVLNMLFRYTSAPNQPDFIGKGPFSGISFDITTNTTRSIANHIARSYGEDLILVLYNRAPSFKVFP